MSNLSVLRCTREEFASLEPEVGQVVVIDTPEEDIAFADDLLRDPN